MNNILNWLRKNGFKIDSDSIVYDDEEHGGNISHIYTEKGALYFCIIAPHEGNNNHYVLRANPKRTFDRWGVCDFQMMFKTPKFLIEFIQDNMVLIYEDILNYYIDCYKTNDD